MFIFAVVLVPTKTWLVTFAASGCGGFTTFQHFTCCFYLVNVPSRANHQTSPAKPKCKNPEPGHTALGCSRVFAGFMASLDDLSNPRSIVSGSSIGIVGPKVVRI